ncbi:MAG: hypothetical protein ACFFG0_54900 [Candidatus Thorarchaeota archaeon]
MEKDHNHDYSQITEMELTDNNRALGIRGFQLRKCICGDQRLYLKNENGEWKKLERNDPIYKLIDFGI